LEHLSRRTVLSVDHLLIVSDCSVRGVRTAGRIADLAREMGTPVKQRGLIVNRVPNGVLPDGVQAAIAALNLPLLATIPHDAQVAEMDAGGIAVGDIAADAPARQVVEKMMMALLGSL
jgi:CO dehydrogenase maturation factor